MWAYIWGELLKAILTEPEPDVKVLLMESCARVSSSIIHLFSPVLLQKAKLKVRNIFNIS
jgi:hypothetical protein